jgi:hypothetical protein
MQQNKIWMGEHLIPPTIVFFKTKNKRSRTQNHHDKLLISDYSKNLTKNNEFNHLIII